MDKGLGEVSNLPPIPGLNPLLKDLPAQFSTLREFQIPVIMDILDAYADGEQVVVLDAPTGSGKTVIAEVVRLMLGMEATYVCHNKDLQLQFLENFEYSRVVWGRANYPVAGPFPHVNCGDCQERAGKDECAYCPKDGCPYALARYDAIQAPVAVLNMAYWLAERQGISLFARDLTIIDEADVLENVLLGQVSVTVTPRMQHDYDITPPTTMTKEESHAPWVEQACEALLPQVRQLKFRARKSSHALREYLRANELLRRLRGMSEDLGQGRSWVYTGGAGSQRRGGELIEFKPVEVGRYGKRVWRAGKYLLMSGTVVSDRMLLEGLGYEGGWRLVSMKSQFPAKNRQVVVRPTVNMGRSSRTEDTISTLFTPIRKILDTHPESILIHTVSYSLARDLLEALEAFLKGSRKVFYHGTGLERYEALAGFKGSPGAILISPSMERGIDLPDDLCRVQILVKLPFPYLGDKQVSERLYGSKNGRVWYNVEVARSLMQMAGRAVRHEEDWAVTYVLDSAFVAWYKEWQRLLPGWFRQGVRVDA